MYKSSVFLLTFIIFVQQSSTNVIRTARNAADNSTIKSESIDSSILINEDLTPFTVDTPQFFIPTYFYPAATLPNEAVAINDLDKDPSELAPVESRMNPGFAFLIVLPKVLFKFLKSLAKTVVIASGIGLAGLAISGLICAFTPVCVLSFAWPGLRNLEVSGRSLVENLSEQMPLDKMESLLELLSVALDRYSTVKQTQARNLQRSQTVTKDEIVNDEE